MDEAFQVLDMIARGVEIDSAAQERWIPAFLTIRWVSRSSRGFVLTPEGSLRGLEVRCSDQRRLGSPSAEAREDASNRLSRCESRPAVPVALWDTSILTPASAPRRIAAELSVFPPSGGVCHGAPPTLTC